MTIEKTRKKEDYLFKIARKVLEWADKRNNYSSFRYTEEELADLVMQTLLNIKEGE